MAEATDGKISKQLLKTRSGEFDVESIHSLCLREAGIDDLGCISECLSLERLDLSRNIISKLHKLAGLTNLHTLNLSGNNITSLEGLQALDNLKTLNLAGNLIGSLESLRCLTGLENLQELRLKDVIHSLSNPVCQNVDYRAEMISMFPNLSVLDGERLKGKGSELYAMCRELDRALEACDDEPSIVAPATKWFSDDVLTLQIPRKFQQSNLYDAEEQLKGVPQVLHHSSMIVYIGSDDYF
ncbi:leucine-rich repeat-containing protein 61-like isoform X2 [Gigantopelta aegis]|uniref:leucine-rich repeat-containing protein 61-like isoform X2 n=1 Tax=Gigantopelta aegis TaxID=1735272 RepID=UPI001B88C52E|nr:leucine-rich repeat-containing protein 61-like isoform X2 [Gigantopelta aegis]